MNPLFHLIRCQVATMPSAASCGTASSSCRTSVTGSSWGLAHRGGHGGRKKGGKMWEKCGKTGEIYDEMGKIWGKLEK
jgi:hypothetical protein